MRIFEYFSNTLTNANQLIHFPDMEAECSDDVMKLRVKFNDTFAGLIYSAGKLVSVFGIV